MAFQWGVPHTWNHNSIRLVSPDLSVLVLSSVPSHPLSPVSASLLFIPGEFLSIKSYFRVISSTRPSSALPSGWLQAGTDRLHLDVSVDCEVLRDKRICLTYLCVLPLNSKVSVHSRRPTTVEQMTTLMGNGSLQCWGVTWWQNILFEGEDGGIFPKTDL